MWAPLPNYKGIFNLFKRTVRQSDCVSIEIYEAKQSDRSPNKRSNLFYFIFKGAKQQSSTSY